jgi:hypothetical protein
MPTLAWREIDLRGYAAGAPARRSPYPELVKEKAADGVGRAAMGAQDPGGDARDFERSAHSLFGRILPKTSCAACPSTSKSPASPFDSADTKPFASLSVM